MKQENMQNRREEVTDGRMASSKTRKHAKQARSSDRRKDCIEQNEKTCKAGAKE